MDKPDCIVEIIGEIPTSGIAYFGFEPSGRLHRGILNPINALRWVASHGLTPVVWVADYHAHLNGKEMGEWNILRKHIPNAEFLIESSTMDDRWMTSLMMLSKVVNLKRTIRSIDCAGREEDTEGMKMSWLLYALLQAVDIHCLDVDVAIGIENEQIPP